MTSSNEDRIILPACPPAGIIVELSKIGFRVQVKLMAEHGRAEGVFENAASSKKKTF